VILVTGAATGPDDPTLAAPGVDAILPKPCTDAELARALRAARARQSARQAQGSQMADARQAFPTFSAAYVSSSSPSCNGAIAA